MTQRPAAVAQKQCCTDRWMGWDGCTDSVDVRHCFSLFSSQPHSRSFRRRSRATRLTVHLYDSTHDDNSVVAIDGSADWRLWRSYSLCRD